jgi:hypothetical protein
MNNVIADELAYVLGHALFIKREIQDIKEMGFLCLRQ